MNIRRKSTRRIIAIALFFGLITYLYPLFYMIGRSFLAFEPGTSSTAVNFTLEHYHKVLGAGGFLNYIFNSLFVLVFVICGNLVFSIMVGYAFARYRFPLKNVFFTMVLITLMVPKQTLMVPILSVMVTLGLHDTLFALILPFCVDSFNVFLMRQYIQELPEDLENAARVDGAGEFEILRKVIFPLAKPAVAVMVINTAIGTWNSFLFPLILTDTATKRTLPVGLAMLTQGPYSTDWGALMAGASVSSLPIIILFLIFQREIIEGITSGAIKD